MTSTFFLTTSCNKTAGPLPSVLTMPARYNMNPPPTYPVREGTINFGWKYETATAATLSLHHCKKNGMWLARNVDETGNFDDIILYSPPLDNNATGRLTFLIQVKYNDKNKRIEKDTLINYDKNEKFCLENCFGDYQKLKSKINSISARRNTIYKHLQNEQKNIRYILHTNRAVLKYDFLEKADHKSYYGNLNGKLYKFKPQELMKYKRLKQIMDLKFFNNLFLCTEDILFKNSKDVLVGELKNVLVEVGCQAMPLDGDMLTKSVIFYKDFFEEWETCLLNNKSVENYPLLGEHVITKVTQIVFDDFLFKFRGINPLEFPNSLNCTAWETLKNTKIVITDPDDRVYPFLKQYIITECEYYRHNKNRKNITNLENCKIYHKTNNTSHSRWCMWMHELLPLVLEIHTVEELEDIFKIISLSNFLRFIVIDHTKKKWSDVTMENCDSLLCYLPSSELLPENYNVDQSQNTASNEILGDIDIISNKLSKSVNICEDVNIHQAIKDKNVAIANEHLSKSNVDAKDKYGKTPLHYAAWKQLLKLAEKIIELGANPNEKDISGKTPLHCAVDAGACDIVELILSVKVAKIDETDNENKTPLYHAVKYGCYEIVKLLLERNANPDIADALERTPLYLAVDRKDTEMVSILLKHNASTEVLYEGNSILHRAVKKGSKEIIKLLLKTIDVNTQNCIKQTALHIACQTWPGNLFSITIDSSVVLRHAENYESIIELLVENKAEVEKQDYHERTPLDYAKEIKENIERYMNQGNLRYSDEDSQIHTVNLSSVLKCYENIILALQNMDVVLVD